MSILFNKWREYLNHRNKYRLLSRSKLLGDIPRNEISGMASVSHFRDLNKNTIVFSERDIADDVYIISQGCVVISTINLNGDHINLANLKNPSHFGTQALLSTPNERRNASAKTTEDSTVLRIPGEAFKKILFKYPTLHDQLIKLGHAQLIQRLSHTIDIFNAPQNEFYQSLQGNIVEYQAGQTIFNKNDLPDFVYYLISGTVDIKLDDSNVHLKAGQLFGELGILNKQPRLGTAIAEENCKLLAINSDTFHHLYEENTKCHDFIMALNQVYKTPTRGSVFLQRGQFMQMETETTTFYLDNHRVVTASQVLGKSIFTMMNADITGATSARYEKNNISREILFLNNKLIGVTTYGYWRDIGKICGMILDETPIEPEKISQFKRTGEFEYPTQTINDNICQCAAVKKIDLMHLIEAGECDLNTLSQKTGAGQVCGSCRPTILELMGKSVWSIAKITQLEILNAHIKLYKIKPTNKTVDAYLPGQHIVMQIYMDKTWLERSYTLISRSGLDDYYELAIKEENLGGFSPWLFKHDHDELLMRISPPQGEFIFNVNDTRPAVFLAGGIGITPAIAFIRALLTHASTRRLHLDYSARTQKDLIFTNELSEAHQTASTISFTLRITKTEGRISKTQLETYQAQFNNPVFYICGNETFNTELSNILLSIGINQSNIKIESFMKK